MARTAEVDTSPYITIQAALDEGLITQSQLDMISDSHLEEMAANAYFELSGEGAVQLDAPVSDPPDGLKSVQEFADGGSPEDRRIGDPHFSGGTMGGILEKSPLAKASFDPDKIHFWPEKFKNKYFGRYFREGESLDDSERSHLEKYRPDLLGGDFVGMKPIPGKDYRDDDEIRAQVMETRGLSSAELYNTLKNLRPIDKILDTSRHEFGHRTQYNSPAVMEYIENVIAPDIKASKHAAGELLMRADGVDKNTISMKQAIDGNWNASDRHVYRRIQKIIKNHIPIIDRLVKGEDRPETVEEKISRMRGYAHGGRVEKISSYSRGNPRKKLERGLVREEAHRKVAGKRPLSEVQAENMDSLISLGVDMTPGIGDVKGASELPGNYRDMISAEGIGDKALYGGIGALNLLGMIPLGGTLADMAKGPLKAMLRKGKKIGGFTTARGSRYNHFDDASTHRFDRSAKDHVDKTTGPQPRSSKTVFANQDDMIRGGLGIFHTPDIGTELEPFTDSAGNMYLRLSYIEGEVISEIPVSMYPEIGMIPIEVIKSSKSPVGSKGRNIHFGSKITEIEEGYAHGGRVEKISSYLRGNPRDELKRGLAREEARRAKIEGKPTLAEDQKRMREGLYRNLIMMSPAEDAYWVGSGEMSEEFKDLFTNKEDSWKMKGLKGLGFGAGLFGMVSPFGDFARKFFKSEKIRKMIEGPKFDKPYKPRTAKEKAELSDTIQEVAKKELPHGKPDAYIQPSDDAFDNAVDTGFFSNDPNHPDFAGNYMYMKSKDGKDYFKNIDTREYVEVPQPKDLGDSKKFDAWRKKNESVRAWPEKNIDDPTNTNIKYDTFRDNLEKQFYAKKKLSRVGATNPGEVIDRFDAYPRSTELGDPSFFFDITAHADKNKESLNSLWMDTPSIVIDIKSHVNDIMSTSLGGSDTGSHIIKIIQNAREKALDLAREHGTDLSLDIVVGSDAAPAVALLTGKWDKRIFSFKDGILSTIIPVSKKLPDGDWKVDEASRLFTKKGSIRPGDFGELGYAEGGIASFQGYRNGGSVKDPRILYDDDGNPYPDPNLNQTTKKLIQARLDALMGRGPTMQSAWINAAAKGVAGFKSPMGGIQAIKNLYNMYANQGAQAVTPEGAMMPVPNAGIGSLTKRGVPGVMQSIFDEKDRKAVIQIKNKRKAATDTSRGKGSVGRKEVTPRWIKVTPKEAKILREFKSDADSFLQDTGQRGTELSTIIDDVYEGRATIRGDDAAVSKLIEDLDDSISDMAIPGDERASLHRIVKKLIKMETSKDPVDTSFSKRRVEQMIEKSKSEKSPRGSRELEELMNAQNSPKYVNQVIKEYGDFRPNIKANLKRFGIKAEIPDNLGQKEIREIDEMFDRPLRDIQDGRDVFYRVENHLKWIQKELLRRYGIRSMKIAGKREGYAHGGIASILRAS